MCYLQSIRSDFIGFVTSRSAAKNCERAGFGAVANLGC